MAAELAPRGVELIDEPVSGGPRGAAKGTLSMMVGASDAQFARVRPILEAIGPQIFHAGGLGTGQVIKMANNLLHHSQRLLSLEAISLAVKNGMDPARAVEIILASSGRNYYIEQNMNSRVLAGQLVTGFNIELTLKDVKLATDLGNDSGVPMFFGNLVREYYRMCMSEMGGATQVNAIALLFDRLAGTHMVPDNPRLE